MKSESTKKRILVAPLNWGLGHATRCIPIINALISYNFEPLIASDGNALALLKKEFPNLNSFELPSYNVSYPKNGNSFKWHFLKSAPHIFRTINKEKQYIKKLVKTEAIDGIISDNRFGVYHPEIPSVYLTHQLNVLSGKTTFFSSKWHQKIIQKFDQCWVPDYENKPNLSGTLGHSKIKLPNVKYIGSLSRFEPKDLKQDTDILAVLSGPEPQRTQLEVKLLKELKQIKRRVVFIKGIVEAFQTKEKINHIEIYNFMSSNELETAVNRSNLVVCRSGYTSIMDLAKLGKKAIFIPTPDQFEQAYLAKKLDDEAIIPFFEQHNFSYKDLKWNANYSGFKTMASSIDFEDLFSLF